MEFMDILNNKDASYLKTHYPQEEVYFDEKGLPCCVKCKTPRYCIIEFDNQVKVFPTLCTCRKIEQEEKEKQERIEKLKQQFLSRQNFAMMGKKYLDVRFSNVVITENNKEIYRKFRNYVKFSEEMIKENIGLFIYGDNSSGKTHATACLCNELLKKGYKCIFTNLATIQNLLLDKRNGMSMEDIIRRFVESDFVFLDDVGKEFIGREYDPSTSKWLEKILFELLNARANADKPTILTSNYSIQELREIVVLDKAIIERINEIATDVILLTGDDFRDAKIKDKQKFLQKYGV
jgi:DNA replication protein DnaC